MIATTLRLRHVKRVLKSTWAKPLALSTAAAAIVLSGSLDSRLHAQELLDLTGGSVDEQVQRAYAGHSRFKLPARPPSMILDDLEVLPQATRDHLATQLLDAAENHGVYLYIAILPTTGGKALPRAGQIILGQWQQGTVNAIILATPQSLKDRDLYLIAASKTLPPEAAPILDQAIRRALYASKKEHESAAQILIGAEAFLEGLLPVAQHMDAIIADPTLFSKARQQIDHSPLTRLKRFKNSLVPWLHWWHPLLFGFLLGLPMLLFWFFKKHRRSQPLIFPEFEAQMRLGAPASGGNNALADFRKRN